MLLKGKNILIVEDNILNRVVYQYVLQTQGATLEFDRWGRQAIMRLQSMEKCDLIIMDLMLDRFRSGYEVFSEIRALAQYANVPIIAVSAADSTEAIEKTRALGFTGFISKPIEEAVFAGQVLSVIEGESIWSEGALRA